MPEPPRLYLDQCLRSEVAEALRDEGYDVVRASDVGKLGPMIQKFLGAQDLRGGS